MYRLAGWLAMVIVAIMVVGFLAAHLVAVLLIIALAAYGHFVRIHRGLR